MCVLSHANAYFLLLQQEAGLIYMSSSCDCILILQQQGGSDMCQNCDLETDTVADICWTSDVCIR